MEKQKIISANINKPMSFLKYLSSIYPDAKRLGYSWRDLVSKNTRDDVIIKVNKYKADQLVLKQIKEKANIDTNSDLKRIEKMLNYRPDLNNITYQDQYIKSYPKIPITIKDARTNELLLSNNKDKHKKSFLQLFRARLDAIDRPKSDVSITINVSIRHMDGSITDKNYGPFQTVMPTELNQDDMYKFVLYTLLNSNINILSGDSIFELGFVILKLEKRDFIYHKMGKLKLENYLLQNQRSIKSHGTVENYLLQNQRSIKSHGTDLCVIDYVFDAIRDKRGFKRYDYKRLQTEINEFVVDGPMISTYELIDWAKNRHPNTVSIHGFDSRYHKFISHISNESRVSLVFIVKDNHCTPITDNKLKEVAIFANRGKCNDLLKHMTDIKWTTRHDNVTKLNNYADLIDTHVSNNILVLPVNTNMNQAIEE